MTNLRRINTQRFFTPVAVLVLAAVLGCSTDYGSGPSNRVATSVDVALVHSEIEVGQTDTATATVLDQYGSPIAGSAVTWSSTFPEVAAVQPTTGRIFAVASGRTEIVATSAGKEARKVLTVSAPAILINEVNPNGDLPGGWVEMFNPTGSAIDMSGWTISGGDITHSFTFPAGVVIAPGGYVAVNEVTLPIELGTTDAVHLFSKYGVQSDSFSWAGNVPGKTYGRCPDGRGPFVDPLDPTRKSANACP
jgi:hypothetical protein